MELTKELLKKAMAAKTPEELIQLAKAEKEELTPEEARDAFAELRRAQELAEEKLDDVSGGGIVVVDFFNVNDKVYYKDGGSWVPGTVIKIGGGFIKIRYTVRFEDGTTKSGINPMDLRKR